jgi:hypothetical protein
VNQTDHLSEKTNLTDLELAVAKLQAVNEQFQKLDQLKEEFFSIVNHELRTPLTSIRAFSEILHDNPDLDADRRHLFLDIILTESERLSRLIHQVIDLVVIESGNVKWRVTDFDLGELVTEALTKAAPLFAAGQITLETEIATPLPIVVADRARVMQVVESLLSNAIKFCHSDAGWVSVRVQAHEGSVQVDVSDNGPGITPAELSTIFNGLVPPQNLLAEKPISPGLELILSRDIILKLGGQLWVESEPGRGATFSFTLPADTIPQ